MSTSRSVTVSAGGPIRGEIIVPGDKSVSHRALMLGAVAHGVTRISGLSEGADVRRTASSLRAMGARMRRQGGEVVVSGGELREPITPLNLGNAGTGMRLICGLLAGRGQMVVLVGDESLSSRPMGRIIEPLSDMGARIHSRSGRAPLVVLPAQLHGIDYVVPVPSAQVKSAILLAGLTAEGQTRVVEPTPTRRYTEDMLAEFGADITVDGPQISVRASELVGREVAVPADPSQAAFWAVGAAIIPGSDVRLPGLDLSTTRVGFIEVLRRMGAAVHLDDGNTLRVAYQDRLRGTDIEPDEVAALVDEIPILAVAAASADGVSTFGGLGELIHKESNRLEGVRRLLDTLGVGVQVRGESLIIEGSPRFVTASSHSNGDHRMAMSAAIAAQLCPEPSTLTGTEVVTTSYPGFFEELEGLRGNRA